MSSSSGYTFQTISVPGYEIAAPFGINDAGTIAGQAENQGQEGAVAFYGTFGNFSTFAYPDSDYTQATGINGADEIIGQYRANTLTNSFSGFLLDGTAATNLTLAVTGAVSANALAINDAGNIAGDYDTADGNIHGFVDVSGSITTIDLGLDMFTEVNAIDDNGDFAGTYLSSETTLADGSLNALFSGFEDIGGVVTTINVPGSDYTQINGMNNNGDLAGSYFVATTSANGIDVTGIRHGFIYHNGQYETIDYPGTDSGTYLTGINDSGEIIGSDALYTAFEATPDMVICYLAGTMIMTVNGEVAVENLRIGDRLPTYFGGVQPIKWIGRQSFSRCFLHNKREQLPIRIEAGALAETIPVRDLYVSPGHSLLLNGELVLARLLLNGVTVTQHYAPEIVHYYQIEFATHDCILADGAWSESYADATGMRAKFHNAAAFGALYPDYVSPPEPRLCAPRPQHGTRLQTLLRPAVLRAAATEPAGMLHGWIDTWSGSGEIAGWAQDEDHPELPVILEIIRSGEVIASILACDYRGDLDARGSGGRHGFTFALPDMGAPDNILNIAVRRMSDGAKLPFSHDLCRQFGLQPAKAPARWSQLKRRTYA